MSEKDKNPKSSPYGIPKNTPEGHPKEHIHGQVPKMKNPPPPPKTDNE